MRWLRALVCMLVLASPVALAAQPPQQPPEGFEPASGVPPEEQIPAIGLVAAAYGFVWVMLIGYAWSIARRLAKVESEIADLERRRPPDAR